MGFATRNLKQQVTRWAATPNGFGGWTYSIPTVQRGRWENRAEEITDPHGVKIVSRAIVFLSSDVNIDDWLGLGDLDTADPTTVTGAFRVRQFFKMPNLRANDWERRAYL